VNRYTQKGIPTYRPLTTRKSLRVVTALVWWRGNVYYQVDQMAAINEKYDTPER